jgi:hypothetical protein
MRFISRSKVHQALRVGALARAVFASSWRHAWLQISEFVRTFALVAAKISLNCGAIIQNVRFFPDNFSQPPFFHIYRSFGRTEFYFSSRLGLESVVLLWGVSREGQRRAGGGDFHARHPPEPFIPAANHQNEYTHITRLSSSTI